MSDKRKTSIQTPHWKIAREEIDYIDTQYGIDVVEELEKILSEEINESILTEITGMDKESREQHKKRNEKIDDLLDGE